MERFAAEKRSCAVACARLVDAGIRLCPGARDREKGSQRVVSDDFLRELLSETPVASGDVSRPWLCPQTPTAKQLEFDKG